MNKKTQPYVVERWAMAQKLGPKKHAHKLLLLTLAVNADADGYSYYPQRMLGEQCDLSRQVVNGHLAWLEAEGHIASRARSRANGSETSKEYLVLFRDGMAWPDGSPAITSAGTRHPVSDRGDAGCQTVPTGTVCGPGHLEETTEEPGEEPTEEPDAREREQADGVGERLVQRV